MDVVAAVESSYPIADNIEVVFAAELATLLPALQATQSAVNSIGLTGYRLWLYSSAQHYL